MVASVPRNAVASIAVRRAMEVKVRVEADVCCRDVSTHTSDGSAHVITVLLIGIAGA